jgi:hypothetical protein
MDGHIPQSYLKTAAAEVTKSGTAAMTNSTERTEELIKERQREREAEQLELLDRAMTLGIDVRSFQADMKTEATEAKRSGTAHIKNDQIEKIIKWSRLEREVKKLEEAPPKKDEMALEKFLKIEPVQAPKRTQVKRKKEQDRGLEL